jgi:hypothetical protein
VPGADYDHIELFGKALHRLFLILATAR